MSVKTRLARKAVSSTAKHSARGTASKLKREPARSGGLLALGAIAGGRAGWRLRSMLGAGALVVVLGLAACGGDDSDTTVTETESAPAQEAPAGEAGSEEATAGETTPSGAPARSVKVTIADFAYDPDPVQVAVDGKVIWQNEDSAPHTATADDGSFDTGTLEEGKLKSETFKEPGTYTYFCEIHPTMKGTLEVVED